MAALLQIVYEHQLPLGLEYVDRDAARQPLEVKLRNGSVREILQTLVRQLPEYRVTFGMGVVEVYSPKARANAANLLNTVMENFNADNQTARMASAMLYGGLQDKLHPGSGGIGDVLDTTFARKVSVHLRKATIYDALDEIVAKDGTLLWTVGVRPERLRALQPGIALWQIYELKFSSQEAAARRDLVGLFPPKP